MNKGFKSIHFCILDFFSIIDALILVGVEDTFARHAHKLKSGAHEFEGLSPIACHLYSMTNNGVTQRSVPQQFPLVLATCHMTLSIIQHLMTRRWMPLGINTYV